MQIKIHISTYTYPYIIQMFMYNAFKGFNAHTINAQNNYISCLFLVEIFVTQ